MGSKFELHSPPTQSNGGLRSLDDTAMTASKRNMTSYWELFKYRDSFDLMLMVVGSIAAMVDGLTLPAMVIIQSHLIDNLELLQNNPALLLPAVSKSCLLFLYTALVSWMSSCLEVSCWMHAGQRQSARIRAKYLQAVLKQDSAFFECDITPAEVINSISADMTLVQDAISEKVGNFVKNFSHFIGGYVVASLQIWRIALLMIPFTPFLLLPGLLYSKTISSMALKMHKCYEKANIIVEQALSSIRTVYSFVAEDVTMKAYSDSLTSIIDLGRKQGLIKGLAVGSNGLMFAAWAFLGWYGAALVASGEANGGQVLTTGFALMTGGLALGNAFCHVKVFSDGCLAAHQIFRVIEHKPSIDIDNQCGQTLEILKGEVEFQTVSFAYPSRTGVPILQGLCLKFCPGKTTAIIGSSGSGKSTIISLIQRLYDPSAGVILLDGVDIKELHLKWLRQHMGLVSQEPALFATSVKENILYGREDASMDEIIVAATLSGVHNFIVKLSNGYDTQVGERGVQMSGGQKQRIAIARALLRKPSILLLDEATSALDAETEASVNHALQKASSGRTTILVAHRVSTLHTADYVVVLQNGCVADILEVDDLDERGKASTRLQETLSKMQRLDYSQPAVPINTDINASIMKRSGGMHAHNSSSKLDSVSDQKYDGNHKTQNPSFCQLLSLAKSEWKQGLWGLLGAAGYGVVQPAYAYLIGELASIYYIEDVEERQHLIKLCSLIFACLSISFLAANLVQHYNFSMMGENVTRKIRTRMLEKFLAFEIGWFDREENCSGALCSRLATDAELVKSLLADRVSLLAQTASTILVSAIIGLHTSWRLALLMIAIQPIVIHAYFHRNRSLADFAKQEAQRHQEASQLASEAVTMHKTISSLCMQEKILSNFESKLEMTKSKMSKRAYQAGMGIGVAQFILFVSWALDFWYGGQLIKSHASTPGEVFKTFFVLVSTGRMLAEAGMLTPDMAKSSSALQFIFKILSRHSLIDPANQEGETPEIIRGDIDFQDVCFSYPLRPHVMIFHNFNLEMKAGSSLALVGPSGSGKSTIVGLLERFYDPQEGQIMIDGINIRNMHVRKIRQHIGLVNQESSLFATTIRENILYGKPGSTEEEIIQAARAANAHGFISALPQGYSTFVGDLGLQLSGGQKQRIAIARAILKDPKVLLLDEATSALDSASERQVQHALLGIMAGRTTVVIAHRLSTIQEANSIAVLQKGSIIERGTHEELMAKGNMGAYFSLVHSQIAPPLLSTKTTLGCAS